MEDWVVVDSDVSEEERPAEEHTVVCPLLLYADVVACRRMCVEHRRQGSAGFWLWY